MSKLAHFSIEGPADVGKVRAAGVIDLAFSALVAMLVLPQPFIRSMLMSGGVTVRSVAAFVGVLLAGIAVVEFAYVGLSLVTWGRTYPMYLLGLGVDAETKPTLREAAGFALGSVLAAIPCVLGIRGAYDGERGLPARLGRVATRSAADHSAD